MRAPLLIPVLLLASCTHLSRENARAPIGAASVSRCERLDDRQAYAGAVAAGGAALAGSAGLATIPADDETLRVSLALVAVAAGALAAGAELVSQRATTSYMRECR